VSNGEWEEFRAEDADPIGVEELKRLNLKGMPEDALIWVMDDYFPDAKIRREGKCIVCEIEEHLHKILGAQVFSLRFCGGDGSAPFGGFRTRVTLSHIRREMTRMYTSLYVGS